MARVKGELMQGGGSLGDQKLGCGMEHPTEVRWHGQVCLRNLVSAGSYRGTSVSVCTQEHRSGRALCARHRAGATESHGSPSSPSADWRAESGVAHGHHVQGCHTHPFDTDLEVSLREESSPGPKLPSCLSHRVRKLTAERSRNVRLRQPEREPSGPPHTPDSQGPSRNRPKPRSDSTSCFQPSFRCSVG